MYIIRNEFYPQGIKFILGDVPYVLWVLKFAKIGPENGSIRYYPQNYVSPIKGNKFSYVVADISDVYT